jgi:IPTL-CTERM motif
MTRLARAALLGVTCLVLCAGAARAQITTPVDLGSNQADGATATSLAVTTAASVPAGGSIIVIADASTIFGPQATGATCSDSAGNTYATDVTESQGVGYVTTLCSTHSIAAPLDTGATITVSWAGTAPNGQLFLVHAFAVTGLAGAALDQTVSTAGTGSSASSGATATTAQANELLFAVFLDTGSTSANAHFVPGTNGTANDCAAGPSYTSLGGVDSGNPPSLFGAFCIVSATGAYSANAALTGNPFWQAALATYKAVPPAVTFTKAFGAPHITQFATTSLSFNLANPGAPATGDSFTDNLPSGLVVATPNGLSGGANCGPGTITAVAGSSSVSLSGATIGTGTPCNFSVNVTGTTTGVKTNVVTESFSNSTATASLTVGPVAPTLGQWALLLFGLLLAGAGYRVVRRRGA